MLDKKTINRYAKILFGSVVLSAISLIADITEISNSSWITNSTLIKLITWLPYAFNIITLALFIYVYLRLRRDYIYLKKNYDQVELQVQEELDLNNSLWKRSIRILRALTLKDFPNPAKRDALEPILDELANRLPEMGKGYKIAIAKPLLDGSFKILAEKGMDPASVHSIEKRANWKLGASFFSNGLHLPEDKPYFLYETGTLNYQNIQTPNGLGNSGSHFVVGIKYHGYPTAILPQNTVGVLSIGIPKRTTLTANEIEILYNRIYSVIKSIELVLLYQIIIENNRYLSKI